MRILCFLMPRLEPRLSPVMCELFDRLERRGFTVDHGIAEQHPWSTGAPLPDHDLVLVKSHSPLTLSLAGALHDRGTHLVNPYPACALAQDKQRANRALAHAGVPIPRTWCTTEPARLADEVGRELGNRPVVVKPFDGYHGRGVAVLDDPDALRTLHTSERPLVVQEHVEHDTDDLKLCVIDGEVFALRKPFSSESHGAAGVAVDVPPDLAEIARRCGHALGLELYGVDVLEGPRGPVVVDVNFFPGYKGVPDAAQLLADAIERAAGRGPMEAARVVPAGR